MIKDKITLEIKDKFREAIKRTVETGKEHGFIMCKDKKENIYPRNIYEGEEGTIKHESPIKCFPNKTQGNFHTHADVSIARRVFKKYIDKDGKFPRELLTSYVEDVAYSEGIDITTPSHGDLVNALVNKCIKRTEGTVCVGSDAVLDRVDCWTAKSTPEDDCNRSRIERMAISTAQEEAIPPKVWIKSLFDKEIINI